MENQNVLYVGTNYHAHDWDVSRWEKDINLMKDASFNVIRLGHLCWDSFEPSNGQFTFEWLDKVMDLCLNAGIKVFLDIPTRPAPTWLHKLYPSIDIVDANGIRQDSHTRYMEDVGDPMFRKYAYRLAEELVKRYVSHKALLAFGLCNELGAGYISYSETAKNRFIEWLINKYNTVDILNKAWSAQRWSRRLNSFDDVVLPSSGMVKAAPERYLDMRRFYSEEIIDYLKQLKNIIKSVAPNSVTSSNHWAESSGIGFDYLNAYKDFVDIPGAGFYPGTNPEDRRALLGACFCIDHRIGELDLPMWCLEFQTGTFGGYACPDKAMRMYAYLSLIYRSQMICAWTWRSMLGGEEQYLFGLLDHDGVLSKKYYEFKQIAEEFKYLQKYCLPRKTESKVAIAYSFESKIVSEYSKDYYKTDYTDQILQVYQTLFDDNMDCNFINLRNISKKYKLIIIPGHCVMDEASAESIRKFVQNGGTVIMTAYSAKVNENNQVFSTSLPGRLSDLFGIRIGGFDRSKTHVASINEGGLKKSDLDIQREYVWISFENVNFKLDIDYYEIIETKTAEILASFTNIKEQLPAITSNNFGKGKAIYIAIPADKDILKPLLNKIYLELDIKKGPITPDGVSARYIDKKRILYVNTTPFKKTIPILEVSKGIITNKTYKTSVELDPYEVDLIEN